MNNYWIKSGLFSLLDRLSGVLFGFGSVYLLLRALSKGEFGVWTLFLTLNATFEMARIGLIQNALIKYVASEENAPLRSQINTASFILNALVTLVQVVFFWLAAPLCAYIWQSPELISMLRLYALTTLFLLPLSQCNFIQQAHCDFVAPFWTSFARQGTFFAYLLYVHLSAQHLSLMDLTIAQSVTTALAAVVSLILCRPYWHFSKQIDWYWVGQLFHFGKYVFGTNLSSMIHKNVDKMMLGSLISTSAVAVYDLAIRINNLIEIPTLSISAIVFPKSAQRIDTEGKPAIKALYEQSVGAMLALIIPAALIIILFPETIITIIAGKKYLDAVPILRLTILFSLILPFGMQFGTTFDAIGKPKINFYMVLFSTLLNAVLNYFFIGIWGIYGSVYATLITISIGFVITQILMYRELGVNTLMPFWYIKDFYIKIAQLIQQKIEKRRNYKHLALAEHAINNMENNTEKL
jgi:lipopolysaccharide exporter